MDVAVLLMMLALAALFTWRSRYDLAAPAALFALTWSIALIGARLPPFDRPAWDLRTWALVIGPPLLLATSTFLVAGKAAIRRPTLRLDLDPQTGFRLHAVLMGALVIGASVLVLEFLVAGGVPLLAANGDELRFKLVFNGPLHLITRLVPMTGILAAIAGLRASGWTRRWYLAIFATALVLVAGQGGRLEVVLMIFTLAIVTFMTHKLGPRTWLALAAVGVLTIGFSSWLFYHRTAQHPDTPFERYLYGEVIPARPGIFAWTIPVQIGASSGLYVLNALVSSNALEDSPGSGLYSFHGLDRALPAKDSQLVASQVTGALVAPTFLADIYGDFGLAGASLWCVACGVAYGFLYRRAISNPGLASITIYAYVCFWLVFLIYVNIWTYFVFWAADLLLLWIGASIIARGTWGLGPLAVRIHRPFVTLARL